MTHFRRDFSVHEKFFGALFWRRSKVELMFDPAMIKHDPSDISDTVHMFKFHFTVENVTKRISVRCTTAQLCSHDSLLHSETVGDSFFPSAPRFVDGGSLIIPCSERVIRWCSF